MRATLALCFTAFMATLMMGFSANAALAKAERFQGWIEIDKGRGLYVDWQKAKPGKQTVFLINGLTYKTTSWDDFVEALAPSGVGIVRYDPEGMGKTLVKHGPVKAEIAIESQARDFEILSRKLGFNGPLNLVGLSYGGGLSIAFAHLFGERIQYAFLMAPYTAPLPDQDKAISKQIAATRIMFPYNPASDDELYAYFLRQNVYLLYPLTEPSVLDHPWKPEAVFQMTQGIRQYDIRQAAGGFPKHSVQLIVAELDQYIPRTILNEFWDLLPEDERGSRVMIKNSEHKIPEDKPALAAKWIDGVLSGQYGKDGESYQIDRDLKITKHPQF